MPDEQGGLGPPWTVLKILHWTTGYFRDLGLDQPRLEAELLLAHVLDCRRIDLYLRHDQPLQEAELNRYRGLIKRRAGREPQAYILGVKEFWSLPFKVTPEVLIPRPDTECIVQKASSRLSEIDGGSPVTVCELGVGSGAISVALAHEHPNCRIWSCDISPRAIAIARDNARINQVQERIFFFCGNWFAAINPARIAFDLIVSNPPYIRGADISGLAPEITRFEPLRALDGGADGLDCITHIIRTAHLHLKPHGHLFLEIGYDQKDAVAAIGESCPVYDRVLFHKDYGGHFRVAQMRRGQ